MMGAKARLWNAYLDLVGALAFYTGSQGGKAFVLQQTGTASPQNVSAAPGEFTSVVLSKVIPSWRPFPFQNQSNSGLEEESSLTSSRFRPTRTQVTLPYITESSFMNRTSSPFPRSEFLPTDDRQDHQDSPGRQGNLMFVTESASLNRTPAVFTNTEPLHAADRQDQRETSGHLGTLAVATEFSLMNWTAPVVTTSGPVRTVGRQDQQDGAGFQDNIAQQVTAGSDLCSARMIPGFTANVSGTFVNERGGYFQSMTYRVVAVGPFIFEDFDPIIWGHFFPCYEVMSAASNTAKFVFYCTTKFKSFRRHKLPLIIINLLREHCPNAHLLDIFKYPSGVSFNISDPAKDESLRNRSKNRGTEDAPGLKHVFVTVKTGVYRPLFLVNYTNVNQGMCTL